MTIEWQENQPLPSYHYCSEDGLIDADVEPSEHRGGYRWDAMIMTWQWQDTATVGIRQAYVHARSGGNTRTADEAKGAAERWIDKQSAASDRRRDEMTNNQPINTTALRALVQSVQDKIDEHPEYDTFTYTREQMNTIVEAMNEIVDETDRHAALVAAVLAGNWTEAARLAKGDKA